MTRALVVMGVAGCGKSAVASALATRLRCTYLEGDEFHPPANIEKMARGFPLHDADRVPWLRSIAAALSESSGPAVVSCSALKTSYRALLRSAGDVRFVHLQASLPTLQTRLTNRTGHFMKSTMLSSQLNDLETLEAGEPGATIDADLPLNVVVDQASLLAQQWGFIAGFACR